MKLLKERCSIHSIYIYVVERMVLRYESCSDSSHEIE